MRQMEDVRLGGGDRGDWLRVRSESEGLARYVATVRERWWVVALVTVVALVIAAAYVATAPSVYQAEADILVTPVSAGDAATDGLGLITESNDPTQDVTTASRLFTTPAVGQRVKQQLRLPGSPTSVFEDVVVEPIAQSNLVAIRAEADTPQGAADLATAVAQSAIAVSTAQLHTQIDQLVPQLQQRLRGVPTAQQSGPGTLGERIADLQALRAGSDPTLRLASSATPPPGRESPKPKLTLAAALIGGLVLGIGAAFGLQALDPRLRREEQLRSLYRLPVLGRIPTMGRGKGDRPLGASQLTRPAVEAFRTLRATVVATLGDHRPRSVLVTSSGASEGKTTTALNLAHALAQAGNRVVLIEADLRRPSVSRAIATSAEVGTAAVLDGRTPLADAIVHVDAYGEDLGFVLVERAGAFDTDLLTLPVVRRLIDASEAVADYVVIDSPPLTDVSDALPLAQEVDAVLVVARLGRSRLRKLVELGETLQQSGVEPIGVVEVGVEVSGDSRYYLDEPASAGAAS